MMKTKFTVVKEERHFDAIHRHRCHRRTYLDANNLRQRHSDKEDRRYD